MNQTLMNAVREILAHPDLDPEGKVSVALHLLDTLGPDEDAPASADGGVPPLPDRPRDPGPPRRKKGAKKGSKKPRELKSAKPVTKVARILAALAELGGTASVADLAAHLGWDGTQRKHLSVALFNLAQKDRVAKKGRGTYALR